MITKLTGGTVLSAGKQMQGKSVYIQNDKISAVTDETLPYDRVIDAKGNYISPGFIDIHVHGGGGFDFTDNGADAVLKAAEFHARHGTTSILPTATACPAEKTERFLSHVETAMKQKSAGPNLLGAHLEGPYFSKKQCGALNADYIKQPDKREYERLIQRWGHVIKRWSFAPELWGSEEFYLCLKQNHIIGSVGHSDGTLEDVRRVYDKGCRLATHLYSGMSTITRHSGYRKLGVVEAALLLDEMSVEVIADAKHLPPELLQLIYKIKGAGKICLVTDAMRGAGMPEGPSILGGLEDGTPCVIEDGVAKLMDRSAFAGSVATADRLVRTYVQKAGVPLEAAVRMMTANPAEAMRLEKKGDILPGMDADILFFDGDINIKKIIIMGREIIL